jgi:signal transduction histidine kinase/CheY-like chemotaxis protein
MRLKDFVTPETHRLAYEVSGRIMAGEILTAEVEHYHKDGHVLALEVTVSMISSGEEGSVLCLYRDIAERKQAELDRVACEAAEAASRTKSIFVANMSHEIRTPMNAVLGFAQVLACDPLLTPKQGECVRIISRNGEYLMRLINDILEISKIESGRLILDEATFCLHDYLDELELMFRSSVVAHGLQLFVERDANVPCYAIADGGKLRQILINLVGNAIKFTETGGITVRAEAVEGKTVEDKDVLHLMVEVQDTGSGISDDDLRLIFDPFQQGKSGAKVGGAGLGLSISRKLVEIMGGELTVTSQVGKGSCFRFDVLLTPAAKAAGRDKLERRRVVSLEPGTGPFRILVVDDVPVNIALAHSLLKPVGFEVAEAANGVEALDVFEQWSPHAVLMDMRMPVMDGYEATRRIKSTEAGRATPVIALTSSVFEDAKKKMMAAGADGHIGKPIRREELLEELRKCMGLRYVFADAPDEIHGRLKSAHMIPEGPEVLPKELIHAMLQAVEEGEINHLIGLIVEVEKLDSVTASALQSLVDRFDYENLGQWLKKRAPADE